MLRDDGRNEADVVRWIGVLRSCGAAEGYARYYSQRVEPARVVEFLLLNAQFPQSVRFSLRQAWEALRALSSDDGDADVPRFAASSATRALGLLTAQLEHATVDEIIESGLQEYLNGVQRDLARVTDHVTRVYLRDEPHEGPPRRRRARDPADGRAAAAVARPVKIRLVHVTRFDYSADVVEGVMEVRLGPSPTRRSGGTASSSA